MYSSFGLLTANYSITAAGLALALAGVVTARNIRYVENRTKKYMMQVFILLIFYAAFNIVFMATVGKPGLALGVTMKAALFLESASSPMLILILVKYCLHLAGVEKPSRTVAYIIMDIMFLLYIALLVYTQFSTTIYYFDEGNHYHRGPYYPVILIIPILMMVEYFITLLYYRDRMTKKQMAPFYGIVAAVIICTAIQSLFYGLQMIVFGASVGAMLLLSTIFKDQSEQYELQQENLRQREQELSQSKINAMMLQINPHFIYNTLGSIDSLCETDVRAAQELIQDFSMYLQNNYTDLSSQPMIPFADELDHLKQYLKIEQVRFPNLRINYEINTDDFMIPSLSVQPLAENAVNHGIFHRPKSAGTITVSSGRTNEGYVVRVSDDGIGFDPSEISPDDGKSHIGINNVRTRLSILCSGRLEIESVKGTGTVCRIVIPYKEEKT